LAGLASQSRQDRREAEELASTAQVFRDEPDGSVVRLAVWGSGTEDLTIRARYPTDGHDVARLVLHSGRSAR
jgi:hypothetical protein